MSLSWLSCASSPCVSFVNSENSSKMSISCYNSVGERGCRQTESNLTWGRRQYCISSRCLSGHLKAEKVTGVLENLSWWNCSLAIVLVLVFITVSGMKVISVEVDGNIASVRDVSAVTWLPTTSLEPFPQSWESHRRSREPFLVKLLGFLVIEI